MVNIESNKHSTPDVIHPVGDTVADMEAIPVGAEVLIIDFGRGTASTGDFVGENRENLLNVVRKDGGVPDHIMLLYTDPRPDPEQVANDIMEREGMTSLDGLGRINLRILRELLTEAARKGGGQ